MPIEIRFSDFSFSVTRHRGEIRVFDQNIYPQARNVLFLPYDGLGPEIVDILPVIDYRTLFRLTMNVKEEVLEVEVKTEDAEYEPKEDDEPKEECKRYHHKFYGTLMLGRHLINQECTKPDIKPLFQPPVKTATIILSDLSDEDAGM